MAALAGGVLAVRAGLDASRDDSTTAPTTLASPTDTVVRPRYYRVRRGDTLETVAARFDTTVAELRRLNPKVDPVALSIGQRIRVA